MQSCPVLLATTSTCRVKLWARGKSFKVDLPGVPGTGQLKLEGTTCPRHAEWTPACSRPSTLHLGYLEP